MYCVDSDELVTAVSVAIENLIRTLSGWLDKEKPDRATISGRFSRKSPFLFHFIIISNPDY
jgi:predicted butyrate kinase (DUF1464 family)